MIKVPFPIPVNLQQLSPKVYRTTGRELPIGLTCQLQGGQLHQRRPGVLIHQNGIEAAGKGSQQIEKERHDSRPTMARVC